MKIKIYLVNKILIYMPIYGAIEHFKQQNTQNNYAFEFIATGSDTETLRYFFEEKNEAETICIYLTSLPDIEEKLEQIKDIKDISVEGLYKNSMLWTMLIDRIPLAIISKQERQESDFDTYWQTVLDKGATKKRLASYPTGTTTDWFVNKSFNKGKVFDIEHIDFGKDQEFNFLVNNKVDFSITLEPWKAEFYNLKIIYDIPIAPFGFTGILSQQSVFEMPEKRKVLEIIINQINMETNLLYKTFEPALYDWEKIYNQNSEEVYKKDRHDYIKKIQPYLSLTPDDEECERAIRWMCVRHIWATDPRKPTPYISSIRHIKTAHELMTDLIARQEKERKIQIAGTHSIHQLKNELMSKVSSPIGRLIAEFRAIDPVGNSKHIEKLLLIEASADALSDKFAKWLQLLNLKFNKEVRQFDYPMGKLKTYIKEKEKEEGMQTPILFEFRDINNIVQTKSLNDIILNIPDLLMTFLIDETIGNAVASYRLKKRATPINLKVVCKQKMYNHEEVIELCISNEGTHLSTDTLASLGTNTVKSRHKGTGFGLYFLNTALDIYDAHIVDNENERYFLPDCENGVVSFKFIFKTNK